MPTIVGYFSIVKPLVEALLCSHGHVSVYSARR